jgi:hypothetical protein
MKQSMTAFFQILTHESIINNHLPILFQAI